MPGIKSGIQRDADAMMVTGKPRIVFAAMRAVRRILYRYELHPFLEPTARYNAMPCDCCMRVCNNSDIWVFDIGFFKTKLELMQVSASFPRIVVYYADPLFTGKLHRIISRHGQLRDPS